mgnify:CR=1 FL=1
MEMRENMLLETLKHDLASALIVLDKDTNVIFINDSALNYLYMMEIEAKTFCDYAIKIAMESSTERKELKIKDRIIGFSLKKVYEGEKLNRIVVIFKDITEIKKSEIDEKRREAMEVIGELALYVAHEIKNTLNVVKGFAQLMRESKSIKVIKNQLEIFIEETDRLNKLTNNMLDYTKSNNFNFEETDMVEFVKDLLTKTFPNEKISLIHMVNEAIVKIDRDRMKQVFINIIQNGIEAIDEETGIFNIYIENEEKLEISFETNKEVEENFELEKVFSPYFTTKKNGNGLGLALCKKIIEEHNGVISVHKNFYNGLTFTVALVK